MQAGQVYSFQVTAAVANAPYTAATASVRVSVGPTPLTITMDGGSARTVSAMDAVVIQVRLLSLWNVAGIMHPHCGLDMCAHSRNMLSACTCQV